MGTHSLLFRLECNCVYSGALSKGDLIVWQFPPKSSCFIRSIFYGCYPVNKALGLPCPQNWSWQWMSKASKASGYSGWVTLPSSPPTGADKVRGFFVGDTLCIQMLKRAKSSHLILYKWVSIFCVGRHINWVKAFCEPCFLLQAH